MILRRTAALLALSILVLAGCADDADDADDAEVGAPGTTTTTTSAPTTTTAAEPDGSVDHSDPPATIETADDTVRSWVAALSEGDLDAAWDLVAERSREAIGGFEAFSDLRSALAEGFGAWAGSEDDAFSVVPLETGGDDALSVVILRDTILQEGPPAPAADAVPVRTTSEGNLVEPFLDLGAVEHQPPPGTALPAEPTLVALAPLNVDVQFVVDDRGAEIPITEDASGDRQRASLELDEALEPGPHSLTVVLTTPQGQVATSTALYSVEG